MNPRMLEATALILAGGRSSRMGRDKVLLPLGDGRTMLERAADFWGALCPQVLIAAGTEAHLPQTLPGQPVYDRFPGCGPMAGLQAGLLAAGNELLFAFAVDQPYPTREAALALWTAMGEADAAVYRLDGRRAPLFGLYRRTCLPVAQTLLEAGTYKMGLLLDRVRTVYVDTTDERLLLNMNTPTEYQQVLNDYGQG